jgi:hypothetical protein
MARCTRYNIIYVKKLVCDLQQVSGFPDFTTNKTDCKDITEILLKVVFEKKNFVVTKMKSINNYNDVS